MRTVQGLGAAENVIVGIGLDAAIQELIGRGELVDETRPAPANAEHHRVAPYHGQFPSRIASGAFQPELVDLEDDRTMAIDQHHVGSQSPRRVVETETFDCRGRREQMDALGLMTVWHLVPQRRAIGVSFRVCKLCEWRRAAQTGWGGYQRYHKPWRS